MMGNMNMNKIWPVIASVGVGVAAYQMMSKKGGGMKNMLPIAASMTGMPDLSGLSQPGKQ
jgi:hypothetical protein